MELLYARTGSLKHVTQLNQHTMPVKNGVALIKLMEKPLISLDLWETRVDGNLCGQDEIIQGNDPKTFRLCVTLCSVLNNLC